jgi:hypothetical protein
LRLADGQSDMRFVRRRRDALLQVGEFLEGIRLEFR